MLAIKYLIAIIFAFSSGLVVAGAIFSFIAAIGVVPRLAQKTATENHIEIYEECIIFGGIFGCLAKFITFYIPMGNILTVIFSFCGGVFFGSLAMSLAEILDVIPILTRRGRVQQGIFFFMLSIALGKLVGSLLYFIVPGFYKF